MVKDILNQLKFLKWTKDTPKLLQITRCLLYTSDAADERSSVDLGGRRIIKKKKNDDTRQVHIIQKKQKENNTNKLQHI